MRISPGLPLRRAMVGVFAVAAIWTPGGTSTAAPPVGGDAEEPAKESVRLAFAQRYSALQHGGIVRAANASISCRATLGTCAAIRRGENLPTGTGGSRAVVNGDLDMFYVDVDSDPNTYNSSRAEVRVPKGGRATYARLYWGGNLKVGEQKPPKDNGRVLIAEPGGQYKELLADTVVGHRVAHGADAYQASADVTKLVRESGSGLYTVAQINVAMGKSAAGAWGGWTLVVAYEKATEPLRHLAVWDGFDALRDRTGDLPLVRLAELPFPAGANGRAGLVAYDGDRGSVGDSLTVSVAGRTTALGDAADPLDDVLNSTVGGPASERVPAYANTLGYDSDVFELDTALRRGGDQLAFRLVSQRDAAWAGALFVAVDARQ
ncbi:DUF3344 domain-containing protein [Streptomyces turgidiscabies]|uniref:DUF3344 domain-containing protein n=1 Tax=Streptomyces turgidiscabies (strain Car8) TaxID=698760 RepID=L7ETY8_STRT8|nr:MULTISPECIES: hypothetical protein [Streptomyces]ELP62482.1 hypothetical protein STRTUCAR8_04092 [Streptomyces turgidiscabies Car8]MDX3497641.1 DUF3344 domain-containing protein [Streptomyces turgidiscabies]GAQ76065.1 hypothetical protein T45_07854 [Streptomyces turgidiscabies]